MESVAITQSFIVNKPSLWAGLEQQSIVQLVSFYPYIFNQMSLGLAVEVVKTFSTHQNTPFLTVIITCRESNRYLKGTNTSFEGQSLREEVVLRIRIVCTLYTYNIILSQQ